MPSICELKMEIKAKGLKGVTGLNKAGLEALLKSGKSAPKKESSKPKPFVPAPTKGESPVVAEKKIDKKINVPKMLMLTYKELDKPVKQKKPKKLSPEIIFYNENKSTIDKYMKTPKPVLSGKIQKIKAIMSGTATKAEKEQASKMYEILTAAILMRK